MDAFNIAPHFRAHHTPDLDGGGPNLSGVAVCQLSILKTLLQTEHMLALLSQ